MKDIRGYGECSDGADDSFVKMPFTYLPSDDVTSEVCVNDHRGRSCSRISSVEQSDEQSTLERHANEFHTEFKVS